MICQHCNSNSLFIKESAAKKIKCKKCGTSSLFKQPVYDNYHENRYLNKIRRNRKNDPMLASILQNLNFKKEEKVLDFGCGAGDYAYNCSQKSPNTVGVDIDISLAKDKYGKKLFKRQEGLKLKFKDNYFNKIICINVIEHIHDYNLLLSEFRRVLKPGGILFITTYNREFKLHAIHNDPTHVIEWNVKEFEKLIKTFFEIDKIYRNGIFFNFYPFNWILVKFIKPEICIIAHK